MSWLDWAPLTSSPDWLAALLLSAHGCYHVSDRQVVTVSAYRPTLRTAAHRDAGEGQPARPLQGIKSMDFLFVRVPKTQQVFLTLNSRNSQRPKRMLEIQSGNTGCRGKDSCGPVPSRHCGKSKSWVLHFLVSARQCCTPRSSFFAQSHLPISPGLTATSLYPFLAHMPMNVFLSAQGVSKRNSRSENVPFLHCSVSGFGKWYLRYFKYPVNKCIFNLK